MNLRHVIGRGIGAGALALLGIGTFAWGQPASVAPAVPPPSTADCPPVAAALAPERVQEGMRDARDHGFLWRVSKDGRTSFLYGTIHAARLEWMFPGPNVRDALAESDTLALEIDPLDPGVQARLVAGMRAQPVVPLSDALARRMAVQMTQQCVDAAAFAKVSPELQIAAISALAGRRDGIDPAYGIDVVLAAYSRGLAKPVISLETPESQIEALQMPTPAARDEFVDGALAELENGRVRPLLIRLATAWADGDWAAMSTYDGWCECVRTPLEVAFMKRLLDDRNPALAASIDALHTSGKRVFAAVGTLHMTGPLGLPTLLQQRGYKVEQGHYGP
jgi:uncharacterized protein YbaP (TraB family)